MGFKISLIGAGGIGSFFCATLADVIKSGQLGNPADVVVMVYDDDAVELKNITYQNFTDDDIGLDKCEAMEARYGFEGYIKRLDKEGLAAAALKSDVVVCAVDNAETRQNLYDLWRDGKVKYFLDLRSTGRVISVFTPGRFEVQRNPENLAKRQDIHAELSATLEGSDGENGSCQRAVEFAAGIIQCGNRIVAPIGVQRLLNYYRGKHVNQRSWIQRI